MKVHEDVKGESIMWIRDWLDAAVVVAWVSAWSVLVYLLPLAGV
ncbi:hypothetical protein VAA_01645 [Vibrio anguillarum 775]|nr:hypothetical protein VAA_01645 [Vibrio anguillarum 775]